MQRIYIWGSPMRFQNLDLNLLVVLDALLDEQSVTRAADRLHLTQPAVSSALRRLREHFGDELLIKIGRRMVRTSLGTQLHKPVNDCLMQLESVLSPKVDFDPGALRRRVVLIAGDWVLLTWLAGLAPRLARLAPGLSVDVILPSCRTFELLSQGEVDLLICPAGRALPEHPSQPLFSDEYCAVVWSGNTRVGTRLTRQRFLELRHAMHRFGDNRLPSVAEDILRSSGLDHELAAQLPSLTLLLETLVGTEYVTTVPRKLAEMYAQRLPLRVLPMPIDFPPMCRVLHWHKHRDRDPFNVWLREQIVAVVASNASQQ
jgi:LysR family transcriptional regulator, nod-box dependent transcriptional activator